MHKENIMAIKNERTVSIILVRSYHQQVQSTYNQLMHQEGAG